MVCETARKSLGITFGALSGSETGKVMITPECIKFAKVP